jgi:hypothetical protein
MDAGDRDNRMDVWNSQRLISLSTLRREGRPSTTQDSLPAAGPALPGGIGYPQGSNKRFHIGMILLFRASWRNVSLPRSTGTTAEQRVYRPNRQKATRTHDPGHSEARPPTIVPRSASIIVLGLITRRGSVSLKRARAPYLSAFGGCDQCGPDLADSILLWYRRILSSTSVLALQSTVAIFPDLRSNWATSRWPRGSDLLGEPG